MLEDLAVNAEAIGSSARVPNRHSFAKWIACSIIALSLTGCGGGGGWYYRPPAGLPPIASSTLSESTAIPLQFLYPLPGYGGNDVLIPVSIGRGSPIYVVLDTGSTGLHVTQSALENSGASGSYTLTSTSIKATYSGGCVFTGNSANSQVSIGPIVVPNLTFDVVQPSSDCGVLGTNGILGIRPALVQDTDDPNVQNPMMLLPGNYRSGFVLSLWASPPTVTVGLTRGIRQEFGATSTPAPVETSPSEPHATYWGPPGESSSNHLQGGFPWCFTAYPSRSATPQPAPIATCTAATVMDSGGESGRIYMGAIAPSWYPVAAPSPEPSAFFAGATYGTPPVGTIIVAAMANDPAMSFTLPAAGTPVACGEYNEEGLLFGPTPPSYFENNTGMSPFFVADVMYDFGDSAFGVRAIPSFAAPPPLFCQ